MRRAIAEWDPFKYEPAPYYGGLDRNFSGRLSRTYVLKFTSVLRAQGRLVEAEFEARNALFDALSIYGRYSGYVADALLALTRVVFDQRRFNDAEELCPDQSRRSARPA